MHPLATDRLYDTARATSVRTRSAPIVMPPVMVADLGDPRTRPFDARVRPFSVARHLGPFACLMIVLWAVWSAYAWVS